MWYVDRIECSAIQRNELSSHKKAWMLTEINHSEKAVYYVIPIICHSGEGGTMDGLKRSEVTRGLGEGGKVK